MPGSSSRHPTPPSTNFQFNSALDLDFYPFLAIEPQPHNGERRAAEDALTLLRM